MRRPDHKTIYKNRWITIATLLILFMPGGLFAHNHTIPTWTIGPKGQGNAWSEFAHLVGDLALSYSYQLRDGSDAVNVNMSAASVDDLYEMQERERQARMVAEKALRALLREKLEQVDWIHTLRVYGQRLTSAQLQVTQGRIRVSGPSLNPSLSENSGEEESSRSVLSVRSGMSVLENNHIGAMVQARFYDMHSSILYNPFAGGDWQVRLDRAINSHSSIEMVYLMKSTDDQNLYAGFRLSF